MDGSVVLHVLLVWSQGHRAQVEGAVAGRVGGNIKEEGRAGEQEGSATDVGGKEAGPNTPKCNQREAEILIGFLNCTCGFFLLFFVLCCESFQPRQRMWRCFSLFFMLKMPTLPCFHECLNKSVETAFLRKLFKKPETWKN